MSNPSSKPPGGNPADPGRDLAPPAWDLFTAQHTSTPRAAYGTAEPICTQHGCCYFATDTEREQWIAEALTANPDQSIYRWDLDRATGQWAARSPGEPDQDSTAVTGVLAALAQRVADGYPDSSIALGQLTYTVHVRRDPDTYPTDGIFDAYTYTREAIAAFRSGAWSFTTVTLQIDTSGVRVQATRHGVAHGLASLQDERDYLAGSLLPALLAEADGYLHAATDAVDTHAGAGPRLPTPGRLIPATLTRDAYPVVAWIPTFGTTYGAVAVAYRPEPEYEHAPYVVWQLHAQPDATSQYHIVDGRYDLEDLGEALIEATARADHETGCLDVDHDHGPS